MGCWWSGCSSLCHSCPSLHITGLLIRIQPFAYWLPSWLLGNKDCFMGRKWKKQNKFCSEEQILFPFFPVTDDPHSYGLIKISGWQEAKRGSPCLHSTPSPAWVTEIRRGALSGTCLATNVISSCGSNCRAGHQCLVSSTDDRVPLYCSVIRFFLGSHLTWKIVFPLKWSWKTV